MPKPPSAGNSNAINMKDENNLVANSESRVTFTFDNPCTKQIPDLVYVRAVLAADYVDNYSAIPVSLSAGTPLNTIIEKQTTGCTVTVSGPQNETLRNASVNLHYAAFEFAK